MDIRRLGIALAALSLVYLGAELVFNVLLLDVTATAHADADTIEHVQLFGRGASGFGFTLLVLGLFQPTGFRIEGKRGWRLFAALAFVCVLPLLLSFGQIFFGLFDASGGRDDLSYLSGMFWAMVPFIGIAMVLASRGRKPTLVAAGLVVLAWPAMFYGQVMAVERLLVAPTTVEERRDANYILLLKAGIEDCVVALDGQNLCDAAAGASPENRAVRAVMGALFMIDPAAVFQSLGPERDHIVGGIAASGLLFPVEDYYAKYVARVSSERNKAIALLHDKYYVPYSKASETWQSAADPQKRRRMAEAAADGVEAAQQQAAEGYAQAVAAIETTIDKGRKDSAAAQTAAEKAIDDGWMKYQKAVASYHASLMTAVRSAAAAAGPEVADLARDCNNGADCVERLRAEYHSFCRTHPCTVEIDDVIAQQRAFAEQSFHDTTGYPSTVADRAAFVREKKTQDVLREQVQQGLRTALEDRSFRLPQGWTYAQDSFGPSLDKTMQEALRARVERDMRTMLDAPDFSLPQGWVYDRAAFRALTWPLAKKRLDAQIERRIQSALGDTSFTLGAGWAYKRADFIAMIDTRLSQGLTEGWDRKARAIFGRPVPPGLEESAFFDALGLPAVPKLQDLLLPMPDFVDTYIKPMSDKVADKAIAKIKMDAPDYANGAKLSAAGKDFVRALYIPVIALCISLTIVVLTIAKNLMLLSAALVERHVRLTPWQKRGLKPVLMAFFLFVAILLPYARANVPVAGAAYQAYHRIATARAPVRAAVLDWIVRVQPVIYRAGRLFVK